MASEFLITVGFKNQWNPTASTRYTPRQLARTTTQPRSRLLEVRIRKVTLPPAVARADSLLVAAAGHPVQIASPPPGIGPEYYTASCPKKSNSSAKKDRLCQRILER
jgi:hypothetical protein